MTRATQGVGREMCVVSHRREAMACKKLAETEKACISFLQEVSGCEGRVESCELDIYHGCYGGSAPASECERCAR